MLFRWLKQRRRQSLLAEPFPAAWLALLYDHLALFPFLDADEQARLQCKARVILAEKEWRGHQGFELNDEIKVTIAGLAAMLVLGMTDEYYDANQLVLVHPEPFQARRTFHLAGEATIEAEEDVDGQAEYHGPVKLSWATVREEAASPGHGQNLVFHEFAHQLDMRNGEVDGVPLLARSLRQRWQSVMAKEYQQLCDAVDCGRDTFLDPYGATDEGEFFAVATETYFDQPLELREHHPKLHDLLRDYYLVDTAKWFERLALQR